MVIVTRNLKDFTLGNIAILPSCFGIGSVAPCKKGGEKRTIASDRVKSIGTVVIFRKMENYIQEAWE